MAESFIYVTCESEEQAELIGAALVFDRMVACVNIIGGMKSMYWWEGEVQQGEEVVLIAKTTDDLVEAVTMKIKDLHSYDVPCVVAVPLTGGNPDFLSWIREETRSAR